MKILNKISSYSTSLCSIFTIAPQTDYDSIIQSKSATQRIQKTWNRVGKNMWHSIHQFEHEITQNKSTK